jgi:hypothetical protein
MNQDNNTEKEKSKKRKRTLLIILLLLLLLLVGITYSFFHAGMGGSNGGNPSRSSQSVPSSLLDGNGSALPGSPTRKSREEILSELRQKEVVVTDRMSAGISFPNGKEGTKGTWTMENPASNKVVEQCAIELNGKTIAETVPMNPGQHIESVTLSQPVASGTYDVTAIIRYYSTDFKTLLGQAEYRLTLSVS